MIKDAIRRVESFRKRDVWSRKDALLILSGYDPSNHIDGAGHPVGVPVAGIVYLDGKTQAWLNANRQQNIIDDCPRFPEIFEDYLMLSNYSNDGIERRTPSEWIEWAKSKGFTPYWLQESKLANVAKTGRRQEQFDFILEKINQLDYVPLAIPDGGKAKIKKLCLVNAGLFTMTGFDHAWQEGLDNELFKMKNHAKYTRKM